MDLKTNHASPVLTESSSVNISRLAFRQNMLPCSSPTAVLSTGLHLTVPRKKTGILDDVRSTGWLDAMIASSPPPKRVTRDANEKDGAADTELSYQTWMVKYPSGLNTFEKIADHAKGKRIVLFLDYDGTLSPIVDNPDFAFMHKSMRDAVKRAANCFPTAIISGRSREKVLDFVKLTNLYYAGSHGMDIMYPIHKISSDGHTCPVEKQLKKFNLFQPASEFLPMIDEVFNILVEATKDIAGATVENNRFCVSVHFRNVDMTNWPMVGGIVHDMLKNYPRLRLTHGRKVLEIRPIIDWDKGKAVMFLLESLGLNERDDVLPIYVGDDRTDEDAFKVLREGNRGLGILVSSIPKESSAYYSLRNPSEVEMFLKRLVRCKKSHAL
ncbi:hypothetical protein SAY87_011780 [Trapa incisa]|uniref:Trehalose 6-phosphate phosphatase n=1 Tax=Trapa incisa TaxID=236973 RepID=A0AAN7GJ09_9MYRT|nr:hypothetical protein SAY87_011780 [Trapa incisa]